MTKKDYIEASRIVGRVAKASGPEVAQIVTASFVALFTIDNERFDFDRFIDACQKEAAA